MLIEKIKIGKKYDIEWLDGYEDVECVFVKKHRNFLVFLGKDGMKVVCRPESIRAVKEVES
jgi:hypothetical protein